jgi:cell division protein FtsW
MKKDPTTGKPAHVAAADEAGTDGAPRLDVVLAQLRPRQRPLPRERTALAIWFWEIDRVLLGLIVTLIAIGLVAVAAASPVGAIDRSTSRVTVDSLHYFYRQLAFVGLGLPLMIVVSMLPRTQARRLAVGLSALFAVLLLLVPVIGNEINGATRWIGSATFRLQPSEFLKPVYVVLTAWLLSLRARDPSLPVVPLTGMVTAIIATLLMRQPDFGQTVIFCAVWGTMLLVSGVSIRLIGVLASAGLLLIVATYLLYDNARDRINSFLGIGAGPAAGPDQVLLAHQTITHGGLFGVGPGAGTEKFRLPEAHTDYIASVIGEEFGLFACIVIACLYFAILARVLLRLLDEEDPFIILASSGLAAALGIQAMINLGVNTQILPSKGMTLPFISYGGSSMLALCLGVGLLLAFTRRNPYMSRSPYVMTWSGR